MRILLLTDLFPPEMTGGAGRVAALQTRALRELGHEVHVLTTSREATSSPDIQVDGISVHRLPVAYPMRWQSYLSLYNPIVSRRISHFFDTLSPDIVHAHNIHAYLTYHSLVQAHQRNWPVVLTAHDTMTMTYQKFDEFIDPSHYEIPDHFEYRVNPWDQLRRQRFRYFPLRNALIRRVVRHNVDALISPSHALLDVLAANRVQACRMIHLPNGIDPSEFSTTSEDRHQFRIDNDLVGRQIVLVAGRINQAKGGRQIVEALELIVNQVPGAVLLILAKPDGYAQTMLSIAESRGIRQYIRFAGWLSGEQLAAAFGAADVCVVPSVYFDNFPTVNLEAMAASTPVVATCFGGSREVVVDHETGFIVNPYATDSLADQVIRLLTDDALRTEMGSRSRQRILEDYDWLNQARKLVAIYQQI